jgi:hypothetical protein
LLLVRFKDSTYACFVARQIGGKPLEAGTGPDRGNRKFGAQLTISGGRPAQNNYRLDGVSINEYSDVAPGSVLGSNLGVDLECGSGQAGAGH